MNKLLAFNASQYSGSLEQGEDTREILKGIEELEVRTNDIISKIKKETDIRDKVNMNIALKKLNDKLAKLKESL